jgi:hypothetical protein
MQSLHKFILVLLTAGGIGGESGPLNGFEEERKAFEACEEYNRTSATT